MTIALIRHGATAGNLASRYVGTTDEPLTEAARADIFSRRFPHAERVLVSPMRRAAETARLIYPGVQTTVVNDFREIDFGAFEMKNHAELAGDGAYKAWLASMGALPFPGGESREAFVRRVVSAFDGAVAHLKSDAAIVAHGGTIMAILSERALPARGYFDYQVKPLSGFTCEWDGQALTNVRPL